MLPTIMILFEHKSTLKGYHKDFCNTYPDTVLYVVVLSPKSPVSYTLLVSDLHTSFLQYPGYSVAVLPCHTSYRFLDRGRNPRKQRP